MLTRFFTKATPNSGNKDYECSFLNIYNNSYLQD